MEDGQGQQTKDAPQATPHKAYKEKKPMWALGPIIVIIIGVLWLLNNLGVFWAGDVWVPVIIIVVGVYLLVRRKEEKKNSPDE